MPRKKAQKTVKAILFDLGKVILFFNFEPAFRKLARATRLSAKDIEDFFISSGHEVLYDGGKISSVQFFREIKKALDLPLSFNEFKKIWNNIFKPNLPVIRIIKTLKKRGYRLVLVSNTNAMHYEFIRKNYLVLKLFDKHILSFKENVRKPDERIYRTSIRACGCRPEEILYIDDRADLTDAAKGIGINVFTYKNNTAALLERMKALEITL